MVECLRRICLFIGAFCFDIYGQQGHLNPGDFPHSILRCLCNVALNLYLRKHCGQTYGKSSMTRIPKILITKILITVNKNLLHK